MNEIKKPKWDKPKSGIKASGSYGVNTKIDTQIDVGMTADAKHESVEVKIQITKVENKYDAEGTIIKIISKTETAGNLSVGDRVFINRWDIEHLHR